MGISVMSGGDVVIECHPSHAEKVRVAGFLDLAGSGKSVRVAMAMESRPGYLNCQRFKVTVSTNIP